MKVSLFFILIQFSYGYSEKTSDNKIFELEKKLLELKEITNILSQKLSSIDNILKETILKLKHSEVVIHTLTIENHDIRRELDLVNAKLKAKPNAIQDVGLVSPVNATLGLQKRLLLNSNDSISSHKPRVGFTAVTTSVQEHMGIGQILAFPKIVTNVGNGFDQHTGVFRAPMSGLYLFSASVVSYAGQELRCALVHNGNSIANIFAGDSTTYASGSKSILLNLSPNDDVWVKIIHESDNVQGFEWSSFMGVLIST